MKYAKQIQLDVDLRYLSRATVVLGRHGKGLNDFPEGVIRRYLPRKQMEMVRDALPPALRKHVMGVNYTEVRLLSAHIHTTEKSVINFYQTTNGEITKFFEGPIEADDRWSTDNGNGYLNVMMDPLTEVESIVAQDGDVWILDARQPHSVEIMGDTREGMHRFEPNGDLSRMIVQVYINLPFKLVAAQFD
jgi:hypothetical protein